MGSQKMNHKNFIYAGWNKGTDKVYRETNCTFAEGVGTAVDMLGFLIQAGVEHGGDKEVLKKATLDTVMKELSKI